jgi:hypothetical protein
VPKTSRIPRASRNASSIDSGSTTGDVCSKISNTARLASEYADIRGSTITAWGQRRRASAPPIPPHTPCAFAS